MTTYQPPHKAWEKDKLAALVEAIRNGADLKPIAVHGELAITGSHRIEAYQIAEELMESAAEGWEEYRTLEIPTVIVTDDEIKAACEYLETESIWAVEGDEACAALYATTDDDELKSALEDQRGYKNLGDGCVN